MQGKKGIKKINTLVARMQRALGDREFGGLDIGEVLDHATKADVIVLRPFLRDLLLHHDWTVRADALEFVGRFRLRHFLDAVKTRLEDENLIVRNYALTAYYDLLGPKALPLLKRTSDAIDVGNRVMALTLLYVETRNETVFGQLSRILTRKRCRFAHRYAAMSTFDAYLDVRQYPEIIALFEIVRRRVSEEPRAYGLDKDIPKMLSKWKTAH
jgi:hypothetical protein